MSDAAAIFKQHAADLMADRGLSVEYRRASVSYSLTAFEGRSQYQEINSDGMVKDIVSTDFNFLREGFPVTPSRGDIIASNGQLYEVTSYGSSPPAEIVSAGHLLKIHTKARASG